MNPEKDNYTSGELGALCGIPPRTARRYLHTGKIPAVQNPITGRWKVTRESIVAFLKLYGLDTSRLDKPLSRSVIVVDDEEWVVSFIREVLEESGQGWTVEGFSDSYAACIRLGAAAPELVILDLRMPGVDGRQVLQAIRKNPQTTGTPVLLISGYPEDFAEVAGDKLVLRLAKPFNDKQLLTAVEDVLVLG